MTSLAEFTLPADEFALGKVFDEYPSARFELDRVVPTEDTVIPYFWVQNEDGDMEGIAVALVSLPELRSATLMEDMDERGLFRATWEPEATGIMDVIGKTGVTVVSATGSIDGWTFELRADDADFFAAFKQACNELGLPVTLVRLSQLSQVDPESEYGLTADQRQALILAFTEGYYSDPRKTDLESLAAQLGISRQAFAGRLRRGYRNLVGSIFAHDEGEVT